jgi:hypothetical protein
MANTISESVSDITVAPTVIVTGSRSISPNRAMVGNPRRVCDASNDPITIAGTSE